MGHGCRRVHEHILIKTQQQRQQLTFALQTLEQTPLHLVSQASVLRVPVPPAQLRQAQAHPSPQRRVQTTPPSDKPSRSPIRTPAPSPPPCLTHSTRLQRWRRRRGTTARPHPHSLKREVACSSRRSKLDRITSAATFTTSSSDVLPVSSAL